MPVPKTSLIPILYASAKEKISLRGYADTLVYLPHQGKGKNREGGLVAIRFGAVSEVAQALRTAVEGRLSIHAALPDGSIKLAGKCQKYMSQSSTSYPYTEVLLAPTENVVWEQENYGENGIRRHIKQRTCYLFCPKGDHDQLFARIRAASHMPLVPEFRDYFIDEAQKRGILQPLTTVSCTEQFEAWQLILDRNEKNVAQLLEDGLKSGAITVSDPLPNENAFCAISSLTQYLKTFGPVIAQRIKKRFIPLFDPEQETLSQAVQSVDAYIAARAGYHLYGAQLAVAEAVKRKLDAGRPALIVAECGAGKTKIGAAALAASQLGQGKKFNVVLCPSHLKEKWVRELQETVPNAQALIVDDIAQLRMARAQFEHGQSSVYCVISKENARNGYFRAPAVRWHPAQGVFRCPRCGEPVTRQIRAGSTVYEKPADGTFFLRENTENHRCRSCGSALWGPVHDTAQPFGWAKIGGFGYVFLPHRSIYLPLANEAQAERLNALPTELRECSVIRGPRRYPLSTYIRKKMKGKIDGLIADELHNYNNDSGQGEAMAEIASVSKQFIGMTATLINGYASGIFYLLYRLFSHEMKLDGQNYRDPLGFARTYGVVQQSYEIELDDYQSNRRTRVHKQRDKLLPGVSPLIYTKFLMECAVFLSLMDMGEHLPEYEEIPVELSMSAETGQEYTHIESCYRTLARSNPKLAGRLWSRFLGLLTAYPDQPYGHDPILDPEAKKITVCQPKDTLEPGELHEKDRKILELVRLKIEAGERVLIYVSWVRLDTQEKLLQLLSDAGISTVILRQNVPAQKREKWLADRVAEGVQVLITNPSLVETGLDLNSFTALIFYNINYNLFTLRQAARRSWRINQTAPRIEVYFFFYRHSAQARAIELMATKLSAAGIIEGHISDEGLAALSNIQDLSAQLAKELAQGVQDSMEDVRAIFQRMAFRRAESNQAAENRSGHAPSLLLFPEQMVISNACCNFDTPDENDTPPAPCLHPLAIPSPTLYIPDFTVPTRQLTMFELPNTA